MGLRSARPFNRSHRRNRYSPYSQNHRISFTLLWPGNKRICSPFHLVKQRTVAEFAASVFWSFKKIAVFVKALYVPRLRKDRPELVEFQENAFNPFCNVDPGGCGNVRTSRLQTNHRHHCIWPVVPIGPQQRRCGTAVIGALRGNHARDTTAHRFLHRPQQLHGWLARFRHRAQRVFIRCRQHPADRIGCPTCWLDHRWHGRLLLGRRSRKQCRPDQRDCSQQRAREQRTNQLRPQPQLTSASWRHARQ